MNAFLVTFSLFYLTLTILPLTFFSYLILKISHKLWLFGISILHPEVEFLKTKTIRTILDTHRNQGIISVLLYVKGQAQPEAVRRYLSEVVRRRDKSGQLIFPRLRHCLVTRCGTYAWQKGKFDLDQNVTVAPLTYKGRTITEYNIQDYVSEIVSKYLPTGIPPWQIIIIPAQEDQHYILLKIHHVLLNEGLNIGDLLPLIPPTRQVSSGTKSPLVQVLPKPVAIPKLKERLDEEITNLWNEFVSNYDPLECIDFLKNTPGFFQYQAIILIALVSTIKEVEKGVSMIKQDVVSRTRFVLVCLKRECRKRKISVMNLAKSILVTLDPRNLIQVMLNNIVLLVTLPLRFYMILFREIGTLFTCYVQSYCKYNGTIVGTIFDYGPILYDCVKELFFYCAKIFEAPTVLIEDILFQEESFQTITLCGRKSVAWSEPVKTEKIRAVSKATGVSDIEIILASISASLSRYFIHTKHLIPDFLPIALRNVNSNYIFASGTKVKPEDSVSGILCINLPILDPEKNVSILENLVDIKRNFNKSLERQGISHLLSWYQTKSNFLTKILPKSILAVYLRYLSRKYTVSVTEMTSRYPNVSQRTLWGQEVNSAIYWRPPQANSSVSLCLNEYADHVRLCVMSDTQLAPHHQVLARGFPDYINDLARSSGISQF